MGHIQVRMRGFVLLLSASALLLGGSTPVTCYAEDGGSVSGVVVDEQGSPVSEVTVTLHVGWARYALTDTFDGWYSIETKTAKTDGDGKFMLVDYPKGAVTTAHVNTGGAAGVTQGTGELKVQLGPLGGVAGKVAGKRQDLKAMRIYVKGGMGLGTANGTVDKKTGKYVLGGLTPGPAQVLVLQDNWTVARLDVEITPGKPTKVKTANFRGKFLPAADPEVDVTKVKLVNADGQPVADTQVSWSSRWMSGSMSSDQDGEVKLAGGGVSIGGPPYHLHLSNLSGENERFHGALKKVKKGVAIIEVKPLREVKGTVKRAGAAVSSYRLFVVGPSKPAQVHHGVVQDGAFTAWVPEGACRFVIGTIDGKVQEQSVAITRETKTIAIQLK